LVAIYVGIFREIACGSSFVGFFRWHAEQSAIYTWRFVAFQVSVNFGSAADFSLFGRNFNRKWYQKCGHILCNWQRDFHRSRFFAETRSLALTLRGLFVYSYGVATSFLYFFLVFFLDEDLGLTPAESVTFAQAIPN